MKELYYAEDYKGNSRVVFVDYITDEAALFMEFFNDDEMIRLLKAFDKNTSLIFNRKKVLWFKKSREAFKGLLAIQRLRGRFQLQLTKGLNYE